MLAAATTAGAHPQHNAVGDRYVKIVVAEGSLRIVYSVSYGPIGAARVRREMDADHDGRLTAAETRRSAVGLARRISRAARLLVDGHAAALAWGEPFVGPATGAVDTSPLTIELTASVPLPGGDVTVAFSDLPELDGIERSDYAFEATPPAVLVSAGAGEVPAGLESRMSFLDRADAGPRVVTAVVQTAGGGPVPLPLVAGVASALVVLGVGVWWVRRRERISARRTGT